MTERKPGEPVSMPSPNAYDTPKQDPNSYWGYPYAGAATVSPGKILANGAVKPLDGYPPIITDVNHPDCAVQQNGVDLRLDEVHVAAGATEFFMDKTQDRRCEFHPVPLNRDDTFFFQPGKQYAVDFMEWVEVPDQMTAYLFMRSSVNRYSGTFMTGLWDSGFKGRLGGIFRPVVPTRIERGFRMAQVVFFHADTHRLYDGQYQGQTNQFEVTK